MHWNVHDSVFIMQIVWCAMCCCAVAWSLMSDSESPGTLFDLLYVFFPPEQSMRVVYDNGCNFLTYCLNRDPRWAAQLRVFVDWMHWKGHTKCGASFSTGVMLTHHASCDKREDKVGLAEIHVIHHDHVLRVHVCRNFQEDG